MKTKSLLTLIGGLALSLCINSAWASKHRYDAQANTDKASTCYRDSTARNPNLLKTLPSDACVAVISPGASTAKNTHCDENGQSARGSDRMCYDYNRGNELWRVVYETPNKGGTHVYQSKILHAVRVTNDGRTELVWDHEAWATGENSKVTSFSKAASTQYALNGGDHNEVVDTHTARGGNASSPTAAAPQLQDCSKFNGWKHALERGQCELANNNAIAAGIEAGKRAMK